MIEFYVFLNNIDIL